MPQAEPSRIDTALREWEAVLGCEWVRSDPVTLQALGRDTRPSQAEIAALLLPGNVEQVRSAIDIATRFGVPLHPISRGRNWGYGGPQPPRDGSAVLSLERLDRIRRFDPELAWIELEPGVSFAALADFLAEQPRCFWPPRTGGPADGSVVGHALARGLAVGWVPDVASTVTGLELVLADGRVVHTGSLGALQGLRPRGVGPDATQLFFQSSLAVVVAMTLQLTPMPARVWPLQFRIRDDRALAAVLDALRPMLQGRLVPIELQLFDDVYQLALGESAAIEARAGAPLSEERREQLRRRWGGARWAARGALFGEDDAQLEHLRRRLEPVLDGQVERLRFHARVDGRTYSSHHSDGLALAWWRKPGERVPGQSPIEARCGLSWLAIAVPQRGEQIVEALATIEARLHAGGCDRAISVRVLDGRSVVMVIPMLFDGDDQAACERVRACQAELLAELAAAGFHPMRLGIGDQLPDGVRDSGLNDRLAAALDPAGVLCRGLYTER